MIFTRDKSFYKNLIMLAIPIALQNLITFSVNLADSVMVGSLGDAAISGMYMGNQIQTLLQVFIAGIEGAILILSAQYWGKGDTFAIRKVVSIGLKAAFISGALLCAVCAILPSFVISLFTKDSAIISTGAEYLSIVCFSYLFFSVTQSLIAAMRSVERAKIGLYVSMASLVVNVALNYVLIFGKLGAPALGIRGAALATLIARFVEMLVIVVYVFFIDKRLGFRASDIPTLDRGLLRDFVRYGAPVILGQLVWAVNMLSSAAIIGRSPHDGAVAAMSIANTVNTLAYVVLNGMASALGIITGKTIGAGKTEKMKEYAKTVQVIFVVLGLVTGAAVQLLKSPVISLYDVSPAALAEARKFINVLSVTIIGTCYQMACLFGLVKSGGDISFVFKMDCVFIFLIVIPSAISATAIGAPAWVVFACLKCDQILKCIVAAVKINRFDWIRDLTQKDRPSEKPI